MFSLFAHFRCLPSTKTLPSAGGEKTRREKGACHEATEEHEAEELNPHRSTEAVSSDKRIVTTNRDMRNRASVLGYFNDSPDFFKKKQEIPS